MNIRDRNRALSRIGLCPHWSMIEFEGIYEGPLDYWEPPCRVCIDCGLTEFSDPNSVYRFERLLGPSHDRPDDASFQILRVSAWPAPNDGELFPLERLENIWIVAEAMDRAGEYRVIDQEAVMELVDKLPEPRRSILLARGVPEWDQDEPNGWW